MKCVASALLVAVALWAQPAGAAEQGAAAVVNGVRIEQWEVEREFQNLLPTTSFHRRVEGERRTELEGRALDALVMKELKRQWAEEQGLSIDESVVNREAMGIRERFPDEAAYREAMVERGMSESGLRRAIARDHFAEAVDEKILSAVPEPTSEDVEVFFAANRADYVTPESRHVLHVLVYVAPSADAGTWQRAEKEAASVAASAAEKTTDLAAEAARRRSDIPPRYRDQTGDLGTIHRGALHADVDGAVFSAVPGEVIGPIRTIYGYSVLQVLSVEPPHPLTLDQVSGAIEARLREERRETALAEFEGRLRTAANIERGAVSEER